jgi:hypothetical protein
VTIPGYSVRYRIVCNDILPAILQNLFVLYLIISSNFRKVPDNCGDRKIVYRYSMFKTEALFKSTLFISYAALGILLEIWELELYIQPHQYRICLP